MTTPNEYPACPGTGQPGIVVQSTWYLQRCPICGRLITPTKAGNMHRHASREWWESKRKVVSDAV